MGEYSQVSGDTLDFGLAGIDEYSQPSGSTVDFELVEATTVSLSEGFSLSDVETDEASFFRSYAPVLAFNDADVREVGKVLDEVVNVNGLDVKQVEKPVSEDLTTDDGVSREASYFKDLNEVFTVDSFTEIKAVLDLFEKISLDEADFKRFDKSLVESLSGNDVYSRESDYFRQQTEILGLNDVFVGGLATRSITVTERFTLDDGIGQAALLELFEDLTVSEGFSREASYFRNYSDSLGVGDFDVFSLQRSLQEGFSTDAFTEAKAVINLFEEFTTSDVDSYAVGKVLDDGLSVDDSIASRDVSIVRDERLRIDDADVRDIRRTLLEGFSFDDAYSREASFLRNYSEGFALGDRDVVFGVGKVLDESFVTSSTPSFSVAKLLTEVAGFNDVYSREADLFRDYSEVFGLDEVEISAIGKQISESFGMDEVYERLASLFREFDATLAVDEAIKKKLTKTFDEVLAEVVTLDDEFDFFFSEGPGTPPYFVRNTFAESFNVNNSFGDREQA